MLFGTAKFVLECCENENRSIAELMLLMEEKKSGKPTTEILENLNHAWEVMLQSIERPLKDGSISGKIIGGEAKKVWDYYQAGNNFCGPLMTKVMAYSLAVTITNASMGLIIATPTAGSAGVLPGTLKAFQEEMDLTNEHIINGILVAGAVGEIIAHSASISGAAGGCQAEIGSASTMTAAALVYLLGGTPKQSFDAGAIAMKSMLGLVCDPVGGLVECPCSKRNVAGAANALWSAEMVMAGVESAVPFDEVISAMDQIGGLMPTVLKETSAGGLADTDTGKEWSRKLAEAAEGLM